MEALSSGKENKRVIRITQRVDTEVLRSLYKGEKIPLFAKVERVGTTVVPTPDHGRGQGRFSGEYVLSITDS